MDRLVTIRFSPRSVATVLAMLAVVGLALRVPNLLVEVFLAAVIASALLPAVRRLERRPHWGRGRAVGVMFVLVAGVLFLLGVVVLPPFVDQASQLAARLPEIGSHTSAQYDALRANGGALRWLPSTGTVFGRLGNDAAAMLGQSLDWVRRTLGAVTAIAIVLVLAFFILFDGPQLRSGVLSLVPPRFRTLVDSQFDPIALKLGHYVQGTLTSMAFFIVFQAVVLTLVGLPLALGVAVLAGLLEVIPVLGTVVGLALGVLLAATISTRMVITVLVVFAVGRLLQDNLVNPYVFATSLKLPPTVVIVALLLGAELIGIEGALIAVPLLAAAQVLVQNLYIEPMERREQREPALEARTTEPANREMRVTFLPQAIDVSRTRYEDEP